MNCKNGNYNRPDLAYFTFPKFLKERLDVWLQFCRRNDRCFRRNSRKAKSGTDNNLRICSVHFRPEQFKKSLIGRCRLIDGANPEIFCFTNPPKMHMYLPYVFHIWTNIYLRCKSIYTTLKSIYTTFQM